MLSSVLHSKHCHHASVCSASRDDRLEQGARTTTQRVGEEVRRAVSNRHRIDSGINGGARAQGQTNRIQGELLDAIDPSRTDLTSWADLQALAEGRTAPRRS